MTIEVLKSKIHRVHITEANVDYVGSITIDSDLLNAANIIRDFDGLARSSRNLLLTPAHRAAAPHIYEVLSAAVAKVGELSPAELTEWIIAEVEKNELLKVIYFAAVDGLSLQTIENWNDSERVQGCIAVQAGEIRLIDNIKLK